MPPAGAMRLSVNGWMNRSGYTQVSAQPPAKKTASLIEKETEVSYEGLTKKMNIEHRTLNVQHRIMYSVNLK